MPYIAPQYRPYIDDEIKTLVKQFREQFIFKNNVDNGAANYVITKAILGMMKPPYGWSYDTLSNVIKTLECSKSEIQRRLLDKHEDRAVDKNGDIEELKYSPN